MNTIIKRESMWIKYIGRCIILMSKIHYPVLVQKLMRGIVARMGLVVGALHSFHVSRVSNGGDAAKIRNGLRTVVSLQEGWSHSRVTKR